MADKKEKELSFEEKEEKIASIIKQLEEDKNLTLKQTATLYKEGKELLKSMNDELTDLKKLVSNEIVKE